jgi:hypothetical protein
MNTPIISPGNFSIQQIHFPDGAANSDFSYLFTDTNLRDLISLTWLGTHSVAAVTPIIGLMIYRAPGVLSYRHFSSCTFDVGDPIEFNAFQSTSFIGRTVQHGSITFALPSPCYIFPNDSLFILCDFPPDNFTFTEINATFKLWTME